MVSKDATKKETRDLSKKEMKKRTPPVCSGVTSGNSLPNTSFYGSASSKNENFLFLACENM